jgi:hypothetical protein
VVVACSSEGGVVGEEVGGALDAVVGVVGGAVEAVVVF